MKLWSKLRPRRVASETGRPAAVSQSCQSSRDTVACSRVWCARSSGVRSGFSPVTSDGTAHREHVLGHQPVRAQSRPVATAVAHRHVHLVALEIHQVRRGGDAHLDAGIGVLERGHAGDQPFGRERGRRADREQPFSLRPAQSFRRTAQVFERAAHGRQIRFRLTRQFQRAIAAHEEGNAKLLLQPPDQVADRGLGDVQLFRGAGEAQVTRRRLEGTQSAERWEESP